MSNSVLLPAMFNSFGKKVMDSTKHLSTDPYWTHSNEHFLSVISFYIFNIQKDEHQDDNTNFNKMVQQMYNFLNQYHTWELLIDHIQLSCEQNPKLSSVLLNDALFYIDNDVEWSQFDILKRNMVLDESVKRLKFLVQSNCKEHKK
ncbi:hypothetical protein [Lysinibacillus fusiformis]|uniref:hypothetical protein n=1 Tax=Lysinibacillus fusiformis TaxID=28031 RepID=UPI00187E338F|nr:hypothetical protein [Lysinibacillus fusiformis]MBD8523866.1 hypothetical protein [Lysinibacillus fusiformis]